MAVIPPSGRRALRLTLAGLWLEALARAFWPLAALGAALLGAWRLGLPVERYALPVALVLGASLLWGLSRLRRPRRLTAEQRLDAHLPGRPFEGLRDQPVLGDAGGLWAAETARMSRSAGRARALLPDLRLSAQDPWGLRLMAMLLLVVGLIFGGSPVASVTDAVTPDLGDAPSWEGWAEPPAYTGEPNLYLPDQAEGALTLPEGTIFTLRFYGDGYALDQDLGSGEPLRLTQSGTLRISGPEKRSWNVTMIPDAPPQIAVSGPATAEKGETLIPFEASDDYGLRSAQARITLDLDALERSFGLTTAPDPQPELVLDLPLPFTRERQNIEGVLREALGEHVWANMPVLVSLSGTDDAGQQGDAAPYAMQLTSKRFFQPIARAVAEQRRDLIWARANAPRVAQVLRAIAWQPESLFSKRDHSDSLRSTIDLIEAQITAPKDDQWQPIEDALWELALELEQGSLNDARERLRRAQERLDEAMRRGASPEEIQELMDELRAAKEDYMRLLAENALPADDGADQPDTGQEQNTVTQDEIDQLMDEIQRLMEEGRMDEARALMEQLNQLLENLQMQESNQSGDGPSTPGERSMEELGESMREQQELSDEAFRQLQDQFNGRENEGEEEGEDAPTPEELAEQQQALREELERQQQRVPGLEGEAAEEAGRALDRAGDAMDRAEEALRQGDLPRAIDQQGEALEQLRRGMGALAEALRENAPEEDATAAEQGEEDGPRVPARDPLGRATEDGQSAGAALPEMLDAPERADELREELRRRLGDRTRPEDERSYLDRLLGQF